MESTEGRNSRVSVRLGLSEEHVYVIPLLYIIPHFGQMSGRDKSGSAHLGHKS